MDSELLGALVASPHWEWLPGMRYHYDHHHYRLTSGRPERGGPVRPPVLSTPSRPNDPDLDDAATCGCLLALVRKAWGDTKTHAEWSASVGGEWIVWRLLADGDRSIIGRGPTEGQSLAAALLAAPIPEVSGA